jgi:hypothetical protein
MSAKKLLALTLMLIVIGAVHVSAQAVTDVKALAGKWKGWGTGSSGSGFPIEVQINADGSYTSQMESGRGSGTFKVADGKITTSGQLSGPNPTPTASQVTLTTKAGKQVLTGQGHSDRGPYSFELTKE